jgi:hypothetical protein
MTTMRLTTFLLVFALAVGSLAVPVAAFGLARSAVHSSLAP